MAKRVPGSEEAPPDVWYSREIAKMVVANKRSAETIRKHMKR
jgi:hypothetical protein